MAVPNPNPRARRTRTALIEAGIALLAERSIDAIAIDELVAVAGVGKGSFFNHFADKSGYAAAVIAGVRHELESWVEAANRSEADPVLRLSGGLATAAAFALARPARARVLLRATPGTAQPDHPLNAGLRADLEAAASAGQIAAPTGAHAVRYWLACSEAVMGGLLARPHGLEAAVDLLGAMLGLALRGLGAAPARIEAATARSRLRALLAATPPPAPAQALPAGP